MHTLHELRFAPDRGARGCGKQEVLGFDVLQSLCLCVFFSHRGARGCGKQGVLGFDVSRSLCVFSLCKFFSF